MSEDAICGCDGGDFEGCPKCSAVPPTTPERAVLMAAARALHRAQYGSARWEQAGEEEREIAVSEAAAALTTGLRSYPVTLGHATFARNLAGFADAIEQDARHAR